MSMGYFVTGTDTGVGKTWVSAYLVAHARSRGANAAYMKPVQTGCTANRDGTLLAPDVEFVHAVSGITPAPDLQEWVCPYRFSLAASPHLAAAEAGQRIDLHRIQEAYNRLAERHAPIIVEGAGGLCVPLSEEESILDLIHLLDLPVVLVCRPGLGTLNHTQLTLRVLKEESIPVAGWMTVSTNDAPWTVIEEDNRRVLRERSGVPYWGHLSYGPVQASAADVARFLLDQPPPPLSSGPHVEQE